MKKRKRSSEKKSAPAALPAIRPMVAGIDIGSEEHWVCGPARVDGQPNVRVFRTTTAQLDELVDWLVEQGVESIAMESTSVYWIPLYELLESRGIEAVLVNARQLHNVPGRKTDFRDCQWIQLLHSCGLLRGSFRPGEAVVALRATQRQLANLVEERTRCVQWIQKALDQMNVQVHRAVSDLTGTTGMAIVRAIVAGERDPLRLAAHRDPRCRKSAEQIAQYLIGNWRDEHLFNLATSLQLYDTIEELIARHQERLLKAMEALQPSDRQDAQVPAHPNPAKERDFKSHGEQRVRTTLWRFAGVDLTRIDGIGIGAANIILTEVGPNLAAFPTEGHFVSWLRLCPRTPISGGKPTKKRRNGLGASRIASALRMAASSLCRSKTALGAAYRRIARHKGADVAVFALARKLAQLAYRMLRFGQDYVDIGDKTYDFQFQVRRLVGLKEAARALGYTLAKDPVPELPRQ
ncbi:MAG TPA: IS110 family transposase [Anaeromyxobacteraceae bacterium]|nr:IS110 family transposase [Anaeromyxobacteraceae bacterium]